jgi:hypothetical protein
MSLSSAKRAFRNKKTAIRAHAQIAVHDLLFGILGDLDHAKSPRSWNEQSGKRKSLSEGYPSSI